MAIVVLTDIENPLGDQKENSESKVAEVLIEIKERIN